MCELLVLGSLAKFVNIKNSLFGRTYRKCVNPNVMLQQPATSATETNSRSHLFFVLRSKDVHVRKK